MVHNFGNGLVTEKWGRHATQERDDPDGGKATPSTVPEFPQQQQQLVRLSASPE